MTRALPAKVSALLERTLESGEAVLWYAQPDVRRSRCPAYAAVPVGGAVLALVLHASTWPIGRWYWLVCVLVLPGLLLACMPFLAHATARATLYVVTSRRALILSAGKQDGVRAYPVRQLPELTLRPRVDGSGDLIFEVETLTDSLGDEQTREYGFEDIADVGMVQDMLKNLALGKDPDLVRRHAALWRLA